MRAGGHGVPPLQLMQVGKLVPVFWAKMELVCMRRSVLTYVYPQRK